MKLRTPDDYHAEIMEQFVLVLLLVLGIGSLGTLAILWWAGYL